MKARMRRREPRGRADGGGSPEPHSPARGFSVQGTAQRKRGSKCPIYDDGDKVYLGVRVKMPVRDLLRNIRLAQGWDTKDFQGICSETVTGDRKRVKTRTGRRTAKKKHPTKSLEELAIIVEVLEEDLKTGNNSCSSSMSMPSPNPSLSPAQSPTGSGYYSDRSDDMSPSPPSYQTYSAGAVDYYQTMSPSDCMHTGFQLSSIGNPENDGGRGEEWADPPSPDWSLDRSSFFWTQLQKEESQLRDISDDVLLATDGHSRTALHKVACVGKRALGYAIGKRMAALNCLDLKDSDGMTALLHAAKHNHHLMVADLIHLGANVNETNNSGKSCLHLSAERGYIRVLEVLKHAMMDGVYVDVEATDNSGMSVLQCASVALKATVCELESSKSLHHTRIHTLRQEQMMETLECLLQMGSYIHTMGSQSMQSTMG